MCPLIRKVIVGTLLIAAVSGVQGAEPAQKTPEPPGANAKSLNLKAPDMRRFFTVSQLQEWANPVLPEYIEEVEVLRKRPSWLGRVAYLFMPYTNPTTTRTKVYRVVDSTQPYLKPVVALPRMAGEPLPYDR